MQSRPDSAALPGWPFAGAIYGVRLADSDEFRYVGMTTVSLRRRRSEHWRNADRGVRTPFSDWLRAKAAREAVYFQPLQIVMSDSIKDLEEAERRWIRTLRERGHRLLNVTEGGVAPRGYRWTDRQKEAIRGKRRGPRIPVPLDGPNNPMWGRQHSEEQKALWSLQRRGMNSGADNPNFGKFGEAHPSFGRTMTAEARERLSLSRRGPLNPNFGKTASDETRAKMSAVRKGRPMPSSVRNAHTRYHTNKGVFKDTCRHCQDDLANKNHEGN